MGTRLEQRMQLEGFVAIGEVLRMGVYALVHRGVVVYVGKSKCMLGRIYTHRSQWSKARSGKPSPSWLPVKGILFDEVHVLPCSPDHLDRLETEMINRYKPRYNIQLKSAEKVAAELTLRIGSTTVQINKAPTPATIPTPAPTFERRV